MGTCSYVLTGTGEAAWGFSMASTAGRDILRACSGHHLTAMIRISHARVCAHPVPACPPLSADKGMEETFGSTCHGAGRARSRNNSRHKLDYQQVLQAWQPQRGPARRMFITQPGQYFAGNLLTAVVFSLSSRCWMRSRPRASPSVWPAPNW